MAAYAILTFPDGTKKTTLMTIDQIHKAWAQGQTRGNSPAHKNFPAEMAKKTVINRACKIAIKSSDDSSLNLVKETMRANDDSITEAIVAAEIEENANQIEVDIVDDTEADYEVVEVEDKPTEQVVTEGPGVLMRLKVLGSSSHGNCYILSAPTGKPRY